jgi:hypothetical protein
MEYSYLKLIHLIAVTVFLGNIITGLFQTDVKAITRIS